MCCAHILMDLQILPDLIQYEMILNELQEKQERTKNSIHKLLFFFLSCFSKQFKSQLLLDYAWRSQNSSVYVGNLSISTPAALLSWSWFLWVCQTFILSQVYISGTQLSPRALYTWATLVYLCEVLCLLWTKQLWPVTTIFTPQASRKSFW